MEAEFSILFFLTDECALLRHGHLHTRTGRHFAGVAEKICHETNFFSVIRMEPETSCKSVLYNQIRL